MARFVNFFKSPYNMKPTAYGILKNLKLYNKAKLRQTHWMPGILAPEADFLFRFNSFL